MNSVTFNSQAPCEHLPRVLDLLRVMSFDLNHMSVEACENASFAIHLTCKSVGNMSLETLNNRIRNIPGVQKYHAV